jgi:hypothetical protein
MQLPRRTETVFEKVQDNEEVHLRQKTLETMMLAKWPKPWQIQMWRWGNFGEFGIIAIAKALKENRKLTTLHLVFKQIGNDGAKAIAKALKRTWHWWLWIFATIKLEKMAPRLLL